MVLDDARRGSEHVSKREAEIRTDLLVLLEAVEELGEETLLLGRLNLGGLN